MTLIEVPNEGRASRTRTTKDGRKITYTMNVAQQPERARACGQGAKSSNDRRPVDPPPIVDLHVYEGEGPNAKDITFSYRASFFVWASLEHSRKLAQARGSQPATNTPVLCGTPVAGASYLERPDQAAYFIFPDLSVRHEGNFRINFTLYEDLKDPRYEDPEPHPPQNEPVPREFVNGRCEVKSSPFVVFSAKKFPGLSESTALSRLVADQGCRVRIRRDVRMRKREPTGPKDWSGRDELTEESLAQHTNNPQSSVHSRAPSGEPVGRPRSNSISSNVSSHQKPAIQAGSEWSSHDLGRMYQPMGPAGTPMGPQPSPQYYRSPAPAAEPHSVQQYSASPYVNQQPNIPHSPQPMNNPQMSPYHPTNVAPSWSYGTQAPQSPAYLPPVDHTRHGSMSYGTSPQEYHPPSGMPQYHNHSHAHTPLVPTESHGYGRSMHQLYPNGSQTATAATNQSQHYSTSLPPLKMRDSIGSYEHSANYTPVAQPRPHQYVSNMPAGAPAPKRGFGSVFDTQHISESLRDGARPDVSSTSASNGRKFESHASDHSSDDESTNDQEIPMEYRRADGRRVQRQWPMCKNTPWNS